MTAATNHLDGRVVVITGAGSGFGQLVATKAGALGARVVGADVSSEGLAATADLVGAAGGEIETVVADVVDRAQMMALGTSAVDRFGAIDIMINNAGIMPLAFFADHDSAGAAWDRCIDINFKGVVHGISAVYDQMISQGRGHVVNISSIYGNYPVAGAGVYGATKAAVNVLSESLRQESLGRIKVTTIKPTGVPGTGLGDGIVNGDALVGILGANAGEFRDKAGAVWGDDPPRRLVDPDSPEYFALAPELLADNIVYAINQPWGVSISDLTVRATGDRYVV